MSSSSSQLVELIELSQELISLNSIQHCNSIWVELSNSNSMTDLIMNKHWMINFYSLIVDEDEINFQSCISFSRRLF